MFLNRAALVVATIVALFTGSIIKAQEQKKEGSAGSQVAFDISIKALLKMPEFENVSIENLIQLDSKESPFGADFKISDIARVSGAISLPARVGDFFKVFYEEQLPFDFIVQLRFANEVHAGQLVDYLARQGFSNEKLGDAMLTRVPIADTKTSVLLRQFGKTSIVIGTRKFLSSSISDAVSDNIRNAWVKCGKGPVRLVCDLKNSRSLVDEIFQIADFGDAQQQLKKVSEDADAFSLSLLPDSGGLLQIGVSANETESMKVLQKRLEFLSFELRAKLNRVLKPLCGKDNKEPVMIDGISTSAEEKEIALHVVKPKNFSDILKKVFQDPAEDMETVKAKEAKPEKQLTQNVATSLMKREESTLIDRAD